MGRALTTRPFLLLLCAALWLTARPADAQWLSEEQAIMGTAIRVELWHEDANAGRAAIAAVMEEMRRIDRLMSPYKEDSELSRINREAPKQPVRISEEMFGLIARAQEISVLTSGAFDITFASVGRHYDYRQRNKPSEQTIRESLPAIDYRHILLDPQARTIRFTVPGVYVDLGGIAKGHAVDNSIALLQQRGVHHAIVTAGGDSRIIGDRRGRPWMMGVREPRSSNSVVAVLPLTDSAISTSGDYERYFVEEGVLYHHILNPKTGHSASEARSVTVVGTDATTTDALSTSVFVMGPDKGMQLVEKLPGIEAVFITQEGEMQFSSGLEDQGGKLTSPTGG